MYWTVYLDESGTHSQSPVLIMGLALSTAERWESFEQKWDAMVRREGLPYIHFTELLGRRSPHYNKYNSPAMWEVLDEANALVVDHVEMSSVAILRKADYNRFYKNREWSGSTRDSALGVLFAAAISFVPHYLTTELIDEDPVINFVYEAGPANAGDLARLFGKFKRLAPPEWQNRIGTLSFAGKGEARGLEAADCISFGALQLERPNYDETVAGNPIEMSPLTIDLEAPRSPGPPAFRLAVGEDILIMMYDRARAERRPGPSRTGEAD